jgi:hypothetical protein
MAQGRKEWYLRKQSKRKTTGKSKIHMETKTNSIQIRKPQKFGEINEI